MEDLMEKEVYFGYDMSDIPMIGKSLFLRKIKVNSRYCSTIRLKTEQILVGPIQKIEQIGENMSILWTEEEGYVVYYVEKAQKSRR